MKRTVRERNSIIITFVFYLILVIILILFSAFDIADKLDKISVQKVETNKLYKEIGLIEKEWLSFDEFKAHATWTEKDQEIIKSLTQDFYNKHLKNNIGESFDEFINKKTEELNSPDNKKLIDENKSQIVNILPTYSEDNIDVLWNNLTDYKFVNYVESIFETFWLSTDSAIGIWKVTLLDEYAVSTSKWDTLESSIYYIPLSINLRWTKKNIVDFLYFIEKVWTIEIKDKELTIVKDDWTLSTGWASRILVWDKNKEWYNIFEHQIIDISSITMTNYIDSSYESRRNQDLIDFIKQKQWNDDFEIKVNLRFYVKWQPKYVVLDFINTVTSNFQKVNVAINKKVSSGSIKWSELLRLKKQQNLLKGLSSKVINLKKELRKQKDLESVYKKAIAINELISPICDSLEWVCE